MTNQPCMSNDLTGAWIFTELAREKGETFAQAVVSSDRWAFPRTTLGQAHALLETFGEHCRCPQCRKAMTRQARRASRPAQRSLFDLMEQS